MFRLEFLYFMLLKTYFCFLRITGGGGHCSSIATRRNWRGDTRNESPTEFFLLLPRERRRAAPNGFWAGERLFVFKFFVSRLCLRFY